MAAGKGNKNNEDFSSVVSAAPQAGYKFDYAVIEFIESGAGEEARVLEEAYRDKKHFTDLDELGDLMAAADKAAGRAGYSKCYVDFHLTNADGKGRTMHGARWDLGDSLEREEHLSNADVAEVERNAAAGAGAWEIRDDEPTFAVDNDFAKQVDVVLSGADAVNTHVKVMNTPSILLQIGARELPVVMTSKHLKSITTYSAERGGHKHGLDTSTVKRLPELLSDPVMVMDSLTRSDSVVLVTEATNAQGSPIIAAVKFNGLGRQNSEVIEANILTSTYGKDGFSSFIRKNIEAGTVLYCNKEKAERMSVNPGVQFPNVMASLSFDTIIRKARAFVNTSEQKNSENFSSLNCKEKSNTLIEFVCNKFLMAAPNVGG